MSLTTKYLTISLMLLSAANLSGCSDKDVYEAPEVVDSTVIAVGDEAGSASTGWSLTNLPNGIYDLEFYSKAVQSADMPYMSANGKMTALTPSSAWAKNIVKGIRVENGNCAIALGNGADVRINNLTLVSAQSDFNMIKGGDVSLLSYLEDKGTKYFNNSGQTDDCLEILKDNGMNLVRLRLYNDPGNAGFYPSNTLPAGYQNVDDMLKLAKRAKDKGMDILLTFHYSDYWTNGSDQYKPHDWSELDFDGLTKAVYEYTADALGKMAAQGTFPSYVSLGNEIQAGLLYPDGACGNPIQMASLLNAGAKAVREKAPEAKIVIHSASNEGLAAAQTGMNWFFGLMRDYGVDYDVIGISYYPFWTQFSATDFRTLAEKTIDLFDKDILVMETGYSWNATLPDGFPGQLANNGPYKELSKIGQRDFIADLSNQIKQVKGGRMLGFIYWDPIFIETPDTGWILGEKNYVSNTTLFGFSGEWLPVLDAFKFNNYMYLLISLLLEGYLFGLVGVSLNLIGAV